MSLLTIFIVITIGYWILNHPATLGNLLFAIVRFSFSLLSQISELLSMTIARGAASNAFGTMLSVPDRVLDWATQHFGHNGGHIPAREDAGGNGGGDQEQTVIKQCAGINKDGKTRCGHRGRAPALAQYFCAAHKGQA